MRRLLMTALLAAMAVPAISVLAEPHHQGQSRHGQAKAAERSTDNRGQRGYQKPKKVHQDNGRHLGWQQYRRYDYNRVDPRYGTYLADRYYRDGRYYQQRRLTDSDRIYRGSDSRYYCRRSDGTTGLIIGAIGGGLLGQAIAPNGSKTLGTILGGGAGALIGRSIGRDGVRCR